MIITVGENSKRYTYVSNKDKDIQQPHPLTLCHTHINVFYEDINFQ